jgi:hypothetical protein
VLGTLLQPTTTVVCFPSPTRPQVRSRAQYSQALRFVRHGMGCVRVVPRRERTHARSADQCVRFPHPLPYRTHALYTGFGFALEPCSLSFAASPLISSLSCLDEVIRCHTRVPAMGGSDQGQRADPRGRRYSSASAYICWDMAGNRAAVTTHSRYRWVSRRS